jgi:ribosomal protein S18 acetylase RimI-like enzyme
VFKLKYTIRRFRISDYDVLIKLWDEAQLVYKPNGRDRREMIQKQIQLPNTIALVAEKEGKLIGSVFGTHDGRRGWINRLAVLPEFQRKGIGRELVKELETRFHKMGIGIIASLVEDWNKTSLRVFQRIGYKKHKDIIYFSKRKTSQI